MTMASMLPALPEIYLTAAICVLLLLDVFFGKDRRRLIAALTLIALLGGALVTASCGVVATRTLLFDGLYVADALGTVLKIAAFLTVALALFYSGGYLDRRRMRGGEYYVLTLCALLGIFVLISANSLLTVYIGVELLALSLYALVAFDRDSGIAAEAAIKYFVLGAIASGMLLYGLSMLYGMTGTLDLERLAIGAAGAEGAGILVGTAFVVVAVAFKFGAVPFHMWVPDVYHGAPTSVTLFIGTAPKIASFALAFRLLAHGLGVAPGDWAQMLMVIAVLSLVIGNLVAIAQANLKRMLAYSAIGNVGFILLGFVCANAVGYQASLGYTLAYVLTTLGSFAVILVAGSAESEADELADYKGFAAREPWLALLMMVLMLSTAGVPPFVGFWVKLWIIQALLDAHHLWLALIAVAVSVIGAFYYLRVVWFMYFEPAAKSPAPAPAPAARFVLTLNTLAVLLLGLLPNALLALCARLI
ncbi:MAG: NADH-quinone oxidoreductase subunit NuoN [Gammaproteobacteria bacterium]|nr:NADH-quinone oxidoreductase subunit NuoN [Gammaproteobacteria bacterium]